MNMIEYEDSNVKLSIKDGMFNCSIKEKINIYLGIRQFANVRSEGDKLFLYLGDKFAPNGFFGITFDNTEIAKKVEDLLKDEIK